MVEREGVRETAVDTEAGERGYMRSSAHEDVKTETMNAAFHGVKD